MGRQIINTGGPARTRYQAIRAAVITLIVVVCVVVLVAFVRIREGHRTVPLGHGRSGVPAQRAPNGS